MNAVPLALAVAMWRVFSSKATPWTGPGNFQFCQCSPVAASQTMTLPSMAEAAMRVPSGEKATEVTLLECPASDVGGLEVADSTSHLCTEPSTQPQTR